MLIKELRGSGLLISLFDFDAEELIDDSLNPIREELKAAAKATEEVLKTSTEVTEEDTKRASLLRQTSRLRDDADPSIRLIGTLLKAHAADGSALVEFTGKGLYPRDLIGPSPDYELVLEFGYRRPHSLRATFNPLKAEAGVRFSLRDAERQALYNDAFEPNSLATARLTRQLAIAGTKLIPTSHELAQRRS